ncbi:MipA/OmpV family protein [Colwelliaceae bacterium 6441]
MKVKFLTMCFWILLFSPEQTFANDKNIEALAAPLGEAVVDQWNFSLLVGYAAIENPLTKRDNIDTYLLPTWSYYGEHFYIDNTSIGYSLIEKDTFLLDVSGYLNEEGAIFNLDNANLSFLDISNYVPKKNWRPNAPEPEYEKIERDFTYMAGVTIHWLNEYIQARLVYGKDISVGHNGEELTLSLFNYYQYGNFKINWQLGAVRKSKKLVDYYFDFRPNEINGVTDTGLDLTAITNTFAQVAVSYKISENWDYVISVKQTWLDDTLLISPILAKDDYFKVLTGINYKF